MLISTVTEAERLNEAEDHFDSGGFREEEYRP